MQGNPSLNQKGVALVMTTIMMLLLSMLAVFLTSQSLTGVKIAGAMKDYEQVFYLADGASQMSIQYLKTHNPPSSSWNPTIQTRASGLPSYMESPVTMTGYTLTPKFQPDVDWEGYDTLPLPGWMLNWQGYSAFHRVHYKAVGEGQLAAKAARDEVGALVIKLAK
jgi:hypothetical protein